MKGYAPRVALKKGTRQLENGLLILPSWHPIVLIEIYLFFCSDDAALS